MALLMKMHRLFKSVTCLAAPEFSRHAIQNIQQDKDIAPVMGGNTTQEPSTIHDQQLRAHDSLVRGNTSI
ncbi:hypothetical protein O9929_15920 [Vibrio lentus]|nr:hypothetical protein [Vibrio lentus]